MGGVYFLWKDVHLHSESTFSKIGGKNPGVKKSCLELLADVASSFTLIT